LAARKTDPVTQLESDRADQIEADTGAAPETDADARPTGHISIVSRTDGFRRAGIVHPLRASYPLDFFTQAQLDAIQAEQDLIDRYGEAEIISLTAPVGQDLTQIDQTRALLSLTSASSEIDSYLRRRYAVPLTTPDPTVVDACCKLARYDLANGPNTTPSDAMRAGRKDAFAAGGPGLVCPHLRPSRAAWRRLPGIGVAFAGSVLAMTEQLQLLVSGPLQRIQIALSGRLREYFPLTRFQHGNVPARITPPIWEDLLRRTPFIGLSWIGWPSKNPGSTYRGPVKFAVYVVAQNPRPDNLMIGDTGQPGVFGLAQLVAAVLHKFKTPDGTAFVTDIGNLYAENWGRMDQGMAGIMVEIEGVELTDPPSFEALDEFLRLQNTWNIGGAISTDTDQIRNQ
jgi:phage gp36-like protein